MREAVIVSAVRTPVGKAPKGTLRATRGLLLRDNLELFALVNNAINWNLLHICSALLATQDEISRLVPAGKGPEVTLWICAAGPRPRKNYCFEQYSGIIVAIGAGLGRACDHRFFTVMGSTRFHPPRPAHRWYLAPMRNPGCGARGDRSW